MLYFFLPKRLDFFLNMLYNIIEGRTSLKTLLKEEGK